MTNRNARRLARTIPFLITSGLALALNSGGHTQAAAAKAPAKQTDDAKAITQDAVRKAIHDYGQGHSSLFSPESSAKPNETEDVYQARISDLLTHEDFAQLERIGEQNRNEKGRLLGGIWKTQAFYEGVGTPVAKGQPNEATFEQQIKRAKKWVAAYPNSITARLALAYLYQHYADLPRGTGTADTVSDSQWNDFHSRAAMAKATLLEASTLKDKDAGWYYAMQRIALDEGWEKSDVRELFDRAADFEPGFYHYYRQYANYILPQWHGEPGELRAFAEEIANRVPGPQGKMLYAYIVSGITCYCREAMQELPQVDYLKVKQGYESIAQLFGTSNLNANRFAYVASTFGDQAGAREAFAGVERMDAEIWYTEEVFNAARKWANAQ